MKDYNKQDLEFIHLLEEIYPQKVVGGLGYEDKPLYDKIYYYCIQRNLDINDYLSYLGFKVKNKATVNTKTKYEVLEQVQKLFPDCQINDIKKLMEKSKRIYQDVCIMGAYEKLTPTEFLYKEGFHVDKFPQKDVLFDADSFRRLTSDYDFNRLKLSSVFNLSVAAFTSLIKMNGEACQHWRGHVLTSKEEDIIDELLEKEKTYYSKDDIHVFVYRSKDESDVALLIINGLKVKCYFEDLPRYYRKAFSRRGYNKYSEEDFVLKREIWEKWASEFIESGGISSAKGYILDDKLIEKLSEVMEEYNKRIPRRFKDINDYLSFLKFDNSIEWAKEELVGTDIKHTELHESGYEFNELCTESRLSYIRKIQGSLNTENRELIRVIRSRELSEQLKELYNYTCQLCSPSEGDVSSSRILLENGKGYVEVHHIVPISQTIKRASEDETNLEVDSYFNVIVVCPNHHKMLHFHQGGFSELIYKQGEVYFISSKGDKLKVHVDLHLKERFD